jgi:lipopolysaccharide exporter
MTPGTESTSIRARIVSGAVWMTALRLIERTIGLVSTLILARLLVPDDFGLVAMGMSVLMALEVFIAFGFEVVLIQKQNATRAHYYTAWTFQVAFGALAAVALLLLATPAALFYRDDRLEAVIYFIALSFLLGSFENIRVVDFRKEMQFDQEMWYRLGTKVAGFVVVIPAAIITRSYWALLFGVLTSNIAKLVLGYAMRPAMPRFSLAMTRDLFSFSGWLMLNNALFMARSRAHDFIIGRLLGARALGLFNIAHEISTLVPTELVAPINRAVFPGYAKMLGEIAKLRETYLDVMACIMLVALPAACGVSAIADVLIPFLLGDAWADSVPLIRVLAIFGALSALTSNSIYIFHALAIPRRVTRLALYELVFLLPVLYYLTATHGLIGAAWAMLLTTLVVSVPWMWVNVTRVLETTVMELVERLWRPLVASGCMYAAVRWQMGAMSAEGFSDTVLVLGAAVVSGVAVYSLLIAALWWLARMPGGAERILIRLVGDRLRRA